MAENMKVFSVLLPMKTEEKQLDRSENLLL